MCFNTDLIQLINRHLYKYLEKWRKLDSRLPLILRGARQVGKTTLIHKLGESFDQYLYFNLEKKADKALFDENDDLSTTVQILFLERGKTNNPNLSTLIFIDEVQEVPRVLESLRYFYEDFPQIHVIATGSLLEFAIQKIENVPVGRVEYATLHPLNFEEYLNGTNDISTLEAILEIPFNNKLLEPIFRKFNQSSQNR